MRKKISGELLDRYLKGECTPEEEAFVKSWYDSFHQDDDYISSADNIEKQLLRDRMFMQISTNLSSDEDFSGRRKVIRLSYFGYAAAVAAVFLIAYLIIPFHTQKQQTAATTEQLVTITNNSKTIREQTLNDGSHVWLNPGAQLTFAKSFGQVNRRLSMSGEAFFEVTKNPQKPFIIRSSHIVTEVWGTSFRVRDTKQSASADVAVVTGKVSVSLPGKTPANISKHIPANTTSSVMLYPDQQATYSGKDNELHTGNGKQPDLLVWEKANLSFDNAKVKDVIPLLDRTFGLNIRTNNKTIDNYYITVDFNGLNFPQVMEVLRNTLNINYEINGKDIVLMKN